MSGILVVNVNQVPENTLMVTSIERRQLFGNMDKLPTVSKHLPHHCHYNNSGDER